MMFLLATICETHKTGVLHESQVFMDNQLENLNRTLYAMNLIHSWYQILAHGGKEVIMQNWSTSKGPHSE